MSIGYSKAMPWVNIKRLSALDSKEFSLKGKCIITQWQRLGLMWKPYENGRTKSK